MNFNPNILVANSRDRRFMVGLSDYPAIFAANYLIIFLSVQDLYTVITSTVITV